MNVFYGYAHETTGVYEWDPLERQKFHGFVAARFKGEELEIEVRKRRTKRSDRQNRALHGMLKPWCDEGHYIDDLKLDILKHVFGTHERVNPITGEITLAANKPHTSQLTVTEFAELMEQAVILAAQCGVLLDLPEEYKAKHRSKYPVTREKRPRAA